MVLDVDIHAAIFEPRLVCGVACGVNSRFDPCLASSKFFWAVNRLFQCQLKVITPTFTVVSPSLLDDFEEPHAARANVAIAARAVKPKFFQFHFEVSTIIYSFFNIFLLLVDKLHQKYF